MDTPFDSADVSYRYIVGIDLGTTNSALAYVDLTADDSASRQIRFLDIPATHGAGGTEPTLDSSFLSLSPRSL